MYNKDYYYDSMGQDQNLTENDYYFNGNPEKNETFNNNTNDNYYYKNNMGYQNMNQYSNAKNNYRGKYPNKNYKKL
jgi:hypothetical protein